MQPGEQVVALSRYPSLHPPHKSIVDPVQVVQALLQLSQVPVYLLANLPSGQLVIHDPSFKYELVGQDKQVLRSEQVAQSDKH